MKRLIYFVLTSLFALSAFAEISVYRNDGNGKVIIESAPDLGKDVYLIKFSGVDSKWENQIIKTTRYKDKERSRYKFPYKYELSSGWKHSKFTIFSEQGQTYKSGSLVKKAELATAEQVNPPHKFYADLEEVKKVKPGILKDNFKEGSFKPGLPHFDE